MRPSKLIHLAFYLNYMMDRGYYSFSIQEIKQQIKARTVFDFLLKVSKDDYFDISPLDADDRTWLLDEFNNMLETIDEDRKLAVQKNGICLLLAYVIELMQKQQRRTA